MSSNAKARASDAGNGRGEGDTFPQSSIPAGEPTIINRSNYDPVEANRRIARQLSDLELLFWRAQQCAILNLAPAEHANHEDERLIIGWRLQGIDTELESRRRRADMPAGETGGFSDAFVADLKERVHLPDLVMEYGDDLRRAGKSWRGVCPFHNGDNPTALSVSPDAGLWHCHVCNRGGDAITWMIARWNMTFPDAVRMLCQFAGIEIPKQSTLKRQPQRRAVNRA
jgi:hypothetical protein